MKKSTVLKGILTSGLMATSFVTYANTSSEDGLFNGTFQAIIETNPTPASSNLHNSFNVESITNTKIITLMRLTPTAEIIERAERVAKRIDEDSDENEPVKAELAKEITPFSDSENAKDLTMNNVPVLDQGKHGTCVTFATTAALDATLDKGDFIDQQCSLAHNLFLGNNYWDGARNAGQVIDPLKKYGIVQQGNCTEKYPNPKLKINTEDYHALVNSEVTLKNIKYSYNRGVEIQDIRDAIDNGKRVAMGFMVKANSDPISVQGYDIIINGEKRKGGLWDCKLPGSTKNYCGFAFAGHEVVVVGYDDNQKLLKIRNSWGSKVAEEGDFYMSYDFFNAMALDATEIWEAAE